MQKFEELKALLSEAEKDAESFFSKGNKAAGTRLRNAMQKLKVTAQDVRNEVIARKNENTK